MVFDNSYQTDETIEEKALKFTFLSKGKRDIVKVIEYRYVQDFIGSLLFNLGFGDYDLENDSIYDNVVSDNGDHYTVFHTVLGTIPRFFEVNPHAVVMVQGSDHTTEFTEKCKTACRKKCIDRCKNTNRRINAYRGYVNKNFDELNKEYSFHGGLRQDDGMILTEEYKKDKQYDSVFCAKK